MNGFTASKPRPSEYVPGSDIELDFELKALYDNPKYAKDDVVTFFSMRDNGRTTRKNYFDSRHRDRIKRIKHEETRSENLRSAFFNSETKKEVVKAHAERRDAWRQEVRDGHEANVRDLNARIKEFEKQMLSHKRALPENEAEKRRLALMNEKRVLLATSKLPIEDRVEADVVLKETLPETSGDASGAKLDYGLKACIMHFNKGKGGHTHKHKCRDVEGNFPNQKVPVHILLSDIEENPLREQYDPGKFRYFHLPTNNMAWIEKVLATYYDEKIEEEHNPLKPPHEVGPAERLLAREYWKGQMHGGSDHPVHARHMRPRCSSIPLSTTATTASAPGSPRQGRSRRPSMLPMEGSKSAPLDMDPSPPEISALNFGKSTAMETAVQPMQNFALFMPYLHWETNSRRSKMAQVINEELEKRKAKPKDPKPSKGKDGDVDPLERFFHAVEQHKLRERYKHLPPARSKTLGPYLMSIAKIADEMDFEADERLLRDHLEDAPLHIRRTLDQSYFWTMEDTTSRDRDQVVFRGTKRGKTYNTRVVMVDQLWLWILDEHTILTSFPRRWGRNKPDPSGVHKSLRERLTHISDGQITSVYDIALIIIDQCSRVFFDRTKPTDERPEVMDIFSNSIAHVTGMKTIAFDSFWRQMAIDSLNPNPKFLTSQGSAGKPSSTSASVYLNVNPEGTLLREAQDIAEELRIMARIFMQQYQVVKDFKKALEKINEMATSDQDKIWGSSYGDDRAYLVSYKRVPKSTIMSANELLEQIHERRSEIEELGEVAKHTCQQLQDLLALKQQQASIIEARMALVRADLSINQGRSIMLFTIVTICFLPLSFFASVFGMNNAEMNGSAMTVHEQLTYMFPLSLLVIIVSLLIAFHPVVRTLLGKLRRKAFYLFGIPQSLFVSLEKRVLAILQERKKKREKCKIKEDMDNEAAQPILGQRVDRPGTGNGFLKRLSRGKEENGAEARMEECV